MYVHLFFLGFIELLESGFISFSDLENLYIALKFTQCELLRSPFPPPVSVTAFINPEFPCAAGSTSGFSLLPCCAYQCTKMILFKYLSLYSMYSTQ